MGKTFQFRNSIICNAVFKPKNRSNISKLKCSFNHITVLQKLSKCEVKAAQCGNVTICMPLRFDVKSNFYAFKLSKMSFLALLEVVNFDFSNFEQFFNSKFTQFQNSESLKLVKMTFLDCFNSPKLDFTYNLSDGKIIKFQQSQALTSHFESFLSIVQYLPMKASPVPPAAALSSFSRLQFLSWLEILLKTCELIKPVYSSTVMSSAVLLGQKLVVERMIATSL